MAKKQKKTQKTPNEIEYLTTGEAQVHKKAKMKAIEATCQALISEKGTVTPNLLVETAQNPNHPLHEYFEWDDTLAAIRFRKAQATMMIIASRYVTYLKSETGKKPIAADKAVRKAVQVRRFLPGAKGLGFLDRKTVLSDEESRKAIIERKIGTLRSWCQSVIDIEELSPIRTNIEALIP
jgi:hypothetical protein